VASVVLSRVRVTMSVNTSCAVNAKLYTLTSSSLPTNPSSGKYLPSRAPPLQPQPSRAPRHSCSDTIRLTLQ
jgi:hypothetical protein